MDPTKRVNDLITITGRLSELLERENDALRNRRNSDLSDILDEKVTLGRVYESRIMGLTDEDVDLSGVDLELRERLKGLGQKVGALMEENAQLLKIAIEANKRVVNLIAEAVRESASNAGTYSASGVSATDAPGAGAQKVGISVAQTL